ncbi:glycosyl transferase, group 1 family protein [Oceaniovalibus guishaninsula JLT2003]|uniref:Glycosyl transferase, group 1 family protein n=1 Tax=Oceaniovalibus guishaninsula JLT2003 TaxID=1231392 RepID=K2H9G9_9RHOB|nr:glycosyltransferase family 4 protein [Oceaniovalibus guishaninsula]EKE43257.1 glycosyl transferase, group 1 family protein [Oceaniovalibus guishaninsula JLT2003]
MPRHRVLLLAEAANPDMVSVPLVGWSIARALADVANVHVVTQIRNRAAFLEAGLVEGRDFNAIDSEAVARPMHRLSRAVSMGSGKGWTTGQAIGAISHAWFERLAWRVSGARIAAREWDVVHRVTPLSPTKSSFVAPRVAAAGVPFVLGPLNGGVPWPAGFDGERRREREWLSYVRGVYKILPGRAGTLAASAAILVGSRHTEAEIPARHRARTLYLPENAVDPARFSRRADPGAGMRAGRPMRACFVGRMVPYKGPDMLLQAAAPLLRGGRMTLDLIGDGPMLAGLKAQAGTLGIAEAVTFHGWLDHRLVQDAMTGCDLMAFPSIREFGGGVVLEAMALGIPPLVVDYAGPGELVRPGLGYTVPLGPRQRIVADLGTALDRLADDPDGLAATGARARDHVAARFTWAAKARQIGRVYDWVTGRADGPPDLSLPAGS